MGPVTEGYFHFSNHFRGLDLVQTTAVFDYDVAGGQAFRMGLAQAVTAVAGVAAIFYFLTQRRRGAEMCLLVGLLVMADGLAMKIIGNAVNAVFDILFAEVDYQTNSQVHDSQVG